MPALPLTGERLCGIGFLYAASRESTVQCVVHLDRKEAGLRFSESEWPRRSGVFPLPESQRQHVRDTARLLADYLRRKLPSHRAEITVDEKPPRAG